MWHDNNIQSEKGDLTIYNKIWKTGTGQGDDYRWSLFHKRLWDDSNRFK